MKWVEYRNIKWGTIVQLKGFCEGLKMLVVILMYHFHIFIGSLSNLGVIFHMLTKHICKVTVFLFRDIKQLKRVFFFFCFLHWACLLGSFYCSVEKYSFFQPFEMLFYQCLKYLMHIMGITLKLICFHVSIFFYLHKTTYLQKTKNQKT